MKIILYILAAIVSLRILWAAALSFLITVSRRTARAFANTNDADYRGEFLSMAVPIAANNGVGPISNDPLMFGNTNSLGCLAGIAESSYTPPTGIPTGNIGVKFIGVSFLSVTAKSALSPSTNKAIAPGDKVYADGGVYDSVTGCLYGFTLDANSSGSYYGNALDAVVAGATTTIRVRMKVTG